MLLGNTESGIPVYCFDLNDYEAEIDGTLVTLIEKPLRETIPTEFDFVDYYGE